MGDEGKHPGDNYGKESRLPAVDPALRADGGTTNLHQDGRRTNVYYWLNPDTGAALYHTEVNGEEANPFFGSVDEAERYLEKHCGEEVSQYEGLTLYNAKVEKVEDAVEVLTDQSGIDEFVPDGGTPQIGNPPAEELWFWYDPAADMILQEEIRPYEVVGLFESETEADRFIRHYMANYGVEDASHLEKYSSELSYHGQGPIVETLEEATEELETEQADFTEFL